MNIFMKRTIFLMVIIFIASLPVIGQNGPFSKVYDERNNNVLYKYTKSFKAKEELCDYVSYNIPSFADGARTIMNMELFEKKYYEEVERVVRHNIPNDSLSTLLKHKINLLYILDCKGRVYDLYFSIPTEATHEIQIELLEHIANIIIKEILFSADLNRHHPTYKKEAEKGKHIWTSVVIPLSFWKN